MEVRKQLLMTNSVRGTDKENIKSEKNSKVKGKYHRDIICSHMPI